MLDHDGVPLTVGDRVAYAGSGREVGVLRTGTVKALITHPLRPWWAMVEILSDRNAKAFRDPSEVLKIAAKP